MTVETKKIADLAKILKQNQLTKLDLTEGSTRLVLEAASGKVILQEEEPETAIFATDVAYEPETVAPQVAAEDVFLQKTPLVGTVYLAPQAGAAPFVKVGDRVKVGDPICIVESMKMFNTIEAAVSGVITDVPVDNGQIVEYGQVLAAIREDA